MSDIAIQVRNISKQYHIGTAQPSYRTLRDTMMDAMTGPFRRAKNLLTGQANSAAGLQETIWALKDVSFEVKKGDAVGIIGHNGAGKSTLLKILSRITTPTIGEARFKGRLGSLLEVGTGFHAELTGRENIYLNGAILGMTRAEINRKFDEIVDFSGVERFLDTPVKHYSSGMYVRLAFAVAAHLEPEILVVDEVLAVGDAEFQKKCLGKMGDVADSGRTVLFVSHNMAAIRKLCNRGVLLDQGKTLYIDEITRVVSRYTSQNQTSTHHTFAIPVPSESTVPGYAYQLTIEDKQGTPTSAIPVGGGWRIRVNMQFDQSVPHFIIALGIFTHDNICLQVSWSQPEQIEPGKYEAVFEQSEVHLGTGTYALSVGLSSHEKSFQYVTNAGLLEISDYSESLDILRTNSSAIVNPIPNRLYRVN